MQARHVIASLALGLGLAAASAPAQVIVTGYTETGNLPRNDDDYSPAASLGFSMIFGGTTFTQVFVSNNGYLTFGEGSGQYYPSPFNADYSGLPIIAAFYSDVDTRNPAGGIVSWGTGLVEGRSAFTAKWDRVGEYSNGSSPNSFSITLVSRSDLSAGSFDLYFTYGTITWDHGSAVAGYHTGSSGNPQYYMLPGSMTTGAFLDGGTNSLATWTNTGTSGGYLLQSRGGVMLTPATVVPEPATVALLGGGLLIVAAGAWRRRRRA